MRSTRQVEFSVLLIGMLVSAGCEPRCERGNTDSMPWDPPPIGEYVSDDGTVVVIDETTVTVTIPDSGTDSDAEPVVLVYSWHVP